MSRPSISMRRTASPLILPPHCRDRLDKEPTLGTPLRRKRPRYQDATFPRSRPALRRHSTGLRSASSRAEDPGAAVARRGERVAGRSAVQFCNTWRKSTSVPFAPVDSVTFMVKIGAISNSVGDDMKKLCLSTVAGAALVAACSANAADLGPRPAYKAPPPPPVVAPVYNWTGFYVGGHFGGGWARKAWEEKSESNGGFGGVCFGGPDFNPLCPFDLLSGAPGSAF